MGERAFTERFAQGVAHGALRLRSNSGNSAGAAGSLGRRCMRFRTHSLRAIVDFSRGVAVSWAFPAPSHIYKDFYPSGDTHSRAVDAPCRLDSPLQHELQEPMPQAIRSTGVRVLLAIAIYVLVVVFAAIVFQSTRISSGNGPHLTWFTGWRSAVSRT